MEDKKVAIITGGGRGIGAATAKLFSQKGYAICINYKSNSEFSTGSYLDLTGGL